MEIIARMKYSVGRMICVNRDRNIRVRVRVPACGASAAEWTRWWNCVCGSIRRLCVYVCYNHPRFGLLLTLARCVCMCLLSYPYQFRFYLFLLMLVLFDPQSISHTNGIKIRNMRHRIITSPIFLKNTITLMRFGTWFCEFVSLWRKPMLFISSWLITCNI